MTFDMENAEALEIYEKCLENIRKWMGNTRKKRAENKAR